MGWYLPYTLHSEFIPHYGTVIWKAFHRRVWIPQPFIHEMTGPLRPVHEDGNIVYLGLPPGVKGETYHQTVPVEFPQGIFHYTSPVSKPEWLQVYQAGSMLEFIGIPSKAGSYTIVLEGTIPNTNNDESEDNEGSALQVKATFSLTIQKKLVVNYDETVVNMVMEQPVYMVPQISGPKNYCFFFANFNTGNLAINSTNGIITGTFYEQGTYTVIIVCVAGEQYTHSTITFNVNQKLSISYPAITAIVGEPICVQPTVLGGYGTKTYSLSDTPQITISSSDDQGFDNPTPTHQTPIQGVSGLTINSVTGEILGIPLEPANTSLQVFCTDESETASTSVSVYILAKLTISGELPVQTVGKPFSFTPKVTGGVPSAYIFSFDCPGGWPGTLTNDPLTGNISGTCYNVIDDLVITITCQDDNQTASLPVVLKVVKSDKS